MEILCFDMALLHEKDEDQLDLRYGTHCQNLKWLESLLLWHKTVYMHLWSVRKANEILSFSNQCQHYIQPPVVFWFYAYLMLMN